MNHVVNAAACSEKRNFIICAYAADIRNFKKVLSVDLTSSIFEGVRAATGRGCLSNFKAQVLCLSLNCSL